VGGVIVSFKSKALLAAVVAGLVLGTTPVLAAPVATAPAKTQTVITTKTEPIIASKASDVYFMTSGETYDKVKSLLEGLSPAVTGINRLNQPYGLRIDKELTGDYFYHAQAYTASDRKVFADYLVAKDNSCAWRMFSGKESVLIYGNTDKLLKRAKVYLLSSRIPKGNVGEIRVRLPGPIPYDLKVTSLNQAVATVDAEQHIVPVSYGKVDVLADIKVGNSVRSDKLRAYVVDRQQWEEERSSTSRPSIGIGIGIGGWHHHHGGVDIGIGGVIWDA
jgi:hypothetical protein